jgi:peptidoglycan/LPS O-acetylase OafA/YrhL
VRVAEEVPVATPLRTAWRALLALAVVAYVATGIPLFFAPSWSSERFAWKVSPFVAMTAGAWCLGTAVFAAWAVLGRRWEPIRPCIAYVLSFGATQLAVALYESDLLRTDVALGWPYLAALGLSVAGGVLAVVDGRSHLGPDRRPGGYRVTPLMRRADVVFVAFVWFLAAVAFWAPARATNGAIFPEPLSLFSLRAFGVFYLSLGVAFAVLVADRRADAVLVGMWCGLALVVPILVATAVYADSFDLSEHPGQLAYPAAYVVALVGAVLILARGWGHRDDPPQSTHRPMG